MDPLTFFKLHISELEYRGSAANPLYIGRCPSCRNLEFRFFDTDPPEIRCARCNLSAWSVEEFVEIVDEYRLPDLKRLVREAENRKALEGEGVTPSEIPTKLKEMEINQETEERRQERMKESAGCRDPLFSCGHPKRVGGAIWALLFLNDRVEGSYKDHGGREWGVVRTPSLKDLIDEMAWTLDQSERNVRNHLNRLKHHNYIRVSQDTGEVHVIDIEAWKEEQE